MSRSSTERLPPARFREVAASKGWKLADLAFRWSITDAHLSRLIANRDRPPVWDDAVLGIPTLSRAAAAELRRQRLAARPIAKSRANKAPAKAGPGYLYHGALVPGAIVIVVRDLGELGTEGDEGVVVETRDTGAGEEYLIRFEAGEDWFNESYVEKFLAETGRVEPERLGQCA